MSSSSRAAMRRKMEEHLGGPPNDPTRCVTDCKVWLKGIEPPYCYCQIRCVLNISREYETLRLLARGIGLVRTLRKSKRYSYIFEYVCLVFLNISNNFVSFMFMKARISGDGYLFLSFP